MKYVRPKKKNLTPVCSDGKYWVSPHERKRKTKIGKVYIENVKGYCCCYHGPYQKIAEEEKISYDHLFFALTIYGEARSENAASKRAIAWIIRNRFTKKKGEDSYRKIVLRPLQFSCWNKDDPNYKLLQSPGKNGLSAHQKAFDKAAWQKCKVTLLEIYNASEKDNPLPGVCHYFSGLPDVKTHPWEKNHFDLPGVPHLHFVKLDK